MKKIVALMLALALVLTLFGCGKTDPVPTTDTTAPAVSEAYTQAAQSLRQAQDLKVELTTKKEIIAQYGSFSSVSEQELILTGIGTDAFVASVSEELEIGELDDEYTEYYADGKLYVNVYDSGYFQGDMSAEDFMARFAPAALLDETLYADVTAQESDAGVNLTFANPTAAESWALPQGAKLLGAEGSAKINTSGVLTKTVYTIDYVQGNTTVCLEVTAEAEIYDEAAPEEPKDTYDYVKIDNIEAPRLFDAAVMYICSSETASSNISQTIVCQAASYTQAMQTQLHFTGSGKAHMSDMQQSVTSVNSTGATDSYVLTEQFRDGQYVYSENGSAFAPDTGVDEQIMLEYVQGVFYGNVPGLDYVSNMKVEQVNGLVSLEMELDAQWGELEAGGLCYELFQDASFLNNYATAYETTTGSYSMTIDPRTGFPLASTLTYAGVHTIEGENYILAEETTQSYCLADSSTYTELTGEIPEETQPEQQATPLLYKVTGADGQEMYLMGTIHVGDERTGFLPEQVYAAFDACDALAVEADIVALETQMTTDTTLAMQMAMCMANPTGSTMQDQLDEEIYDVAVKMMQLSGSYSTNMEYMKPFVWESAISNFYLTLGSLRSEKGMDMRLLKLAKEQGKKILEVESALEQYQMFAGFSDELQILLLEETVNTSPAQYCDEAAQLYDLWCAGDESTLRAMLGEQTDEMTEAEQALYDEYLNAMIIERNEGMLEVAISYLEGDETVFYAVGLAHLLQENGLVDALREAGYTVEQVTYS